MSDQKIVKVESKIEFLSGEDGYYKKVTNPLFTAIVKTDKNPEASAIETELSYHGKKIPGPIFRSWQAFCREVSDTYRGSEAALILMYHSEKGIWDAFPPEQDLSSVHADFSNVTDAIQKFREKKGKEWLVAGTLHSHPGDSGPSSIDVNDEKNMDGVHIIVPRFGQEVENGITAHMSCSKTRFQVDVVAGWLIDFKVGGVADYPDEWIKQCKTGTGHSKKGGYSAGGEYARGYRGGYDYSGSKPLDYKGGPGRWSFKIDNADFNILSETWSYPKVKDVLRRLGIPKAQRKFLMKNFEDDLDEMVEIFSEAREALRYQKEIRGDISSHEREQMIDHAGDLAQRVLEIIKSMCGRIVDQAANDPQVADVIKKAGEEEEDGKEEEQEEPEPEGEETTSRSAPDRVSDPGNTLSHGEF